MVKSSFNLATNPRVNQKTSRLRIVTALLLGLIFLGFGGWRLNGFMTQQGSLRAVASGLRVRQDEAQRKLQAADRIISGQQKIWKDRIDWANGLMNSTTPLLTRRLEQLESLLPGQVKLDVLTFVRGEEKNLALTVVAAREDDLYEMYRRLAAYGLNVSSESTVREGGIKATLSVVFPDQTEVPK